MRSTDKQRFTLNRAYTGLRMATIQSIDAKLDKILKSIGSINKRLDDKDKNLRKDLMTFKTALMESYLTKTLNYLQAVLRNLKMYFKLQRLMKQ